MSNLPPILPLSPARQLWYWISDPVGFLHKNVAQFGDYFTLMLSKGEPLVFVSDPEAVQQIFTQDQTLDSGVHNYLLKPLVGEHSLLLQKGERHRRDRKLLMPPFHGERMKSYGEGMVAATHQAFKHLKSGQHFQARTLTQQITLDVIMTVVFGLNQGDRYERLKPLLVNMLELGSSPLKSSLIFLAPLQKDWGPWSPWGRMLRQRRQIYDLLHAEIRDRRQQPDRDRTDILSLMMSAEYEDGTTMSEAELTDELMTLLFAGHETSATVIAWALHQLSVNPDIWEQLQTELATLGPDPSTNEIARLPYLSAVCDETLRLYPVTPLAFPRSSPEPFQLGDYTLPPNTKMSPCIYLLHQQPDRFPNPQQFDPQRFCDRQYSPYEYIPFGGGNRRCLGYAMALFEIKLILATIVQHYPLQPAATQPPKLVRRGVALAPHNGVPLKLAA